MCIDIWAFVPHIGINNAKEPLRQSAIDSAKCLWSAILFMTVSLALVKISVLLFYKRIFVTPRFTIALWISIALVSSWGIITTVVSSLRSCRNMTYYLKPLLTSIFQSYMLFKAIRYQLFGQALVPFDSML
jgi:hypothetical protein